MELTPPHSYNIISWSSTHGSQITKINKSAENTYLFTVTLMTRLTCVSVVHKCDVLLGLVVNYEVDISEGVIQLRLPGDDVDGRLTGVGAAALAVQCRPVAGT